MTRGRDDVGTPKRKICKKAKTFRFDGSNNDVDDVTRPRDARVRGRHADPVPRGGRRLRVACHRVRPPRAPPPERVATSRFRARPVRASRLRHTRGRARVRFAPPERRGSARRRDDRPRARHDFARGVRTRRPAEPRLAPLGARRAKPAGLRGARRGHHRARPEITRRAARLARFGIDAPPPAGRRPPRRRARDARCARRRRAGARRRRARGRGRRGRRGKRGGKRRRARRTKTKPSARPRRRARRSRGCRPAADAGGRVPRVPARVFVVESRRRRRGRARALLRDPARVRGVRAFPRRRKKRNDAPRVRLHRPGAGGLGGGRGVSERGVSVVGESFQSIRGGGRGRGGDECRWRRARLARGDA